jgi:hypothetical protein
VLLIDQTYKNEKSIAQCLFALTNELKLVACSGAAAVLLVYAWS